MGDPLASAQSLLQVGLVCHFPGLAKLAFLGGLLLTLQLSGINLHGHTCYCSINVLLQTLNGYVTVTNL